MGEGEGERRETVIARGAATPPVVAPLHFAAVSVGYHDLAGHAEMNAECGAGRARPARARGVAPDALALPVHGLQSSAGQRRADLARPVRPTFVAHALLCVVVHTSYPPHYSLPSC